MEKWIDIKGYEGLYQISDQGNVKRLAGSPKCKVDRILKKSISSNGYLSVILYKDGKSKTYRIHRLVLENFSPCENMEKLEVNHLDEDITNNTINNLQWCTHQDNLNYGNRAKKYSKSRGHKVQCIETGKVYDSMREAERDTGCAHTHISECVRGIATHCNGYHWQYAPGVDQQITQNNTD